MVWEGGSLKRNRLQQKKTPKKMGATEMGKWRENNMNMGTQWSTSEAQ